MATTSSPIAALADAVRRYVVWLLVGAYALGAVLPGPGLALRELQLPAWSPGAEPARFSLWMVAVMLFCGAASLDFRRLGELSRRPGLFAAGLVGVWAPPIAVVTIGGALAGWFAGGETSAGVLLGLALVAAMPVANSAVGWTQQSEGDLVWALGFVVLSISLCPWLAPQLLWLMGQTLSEGDAARVDTIVARFSGAVFVVWVLGPTLLGFVFRALAGKAFVRRAKPALVFATAGALVLLNYANASVALPCVVQEADLRLLAVTVGAATVLPAAGLAAAWGMASAARLPRRGRAAWAYALSMKNTGLALSVADSGLGDQPTAVFVILVATLTQHVVAGLAHALCGRTGRTGRSATGSAPGR